MKKLFVLTAIILTQILSAQIVKEVGEFSSLKVYDQINAVLVPSEEYKVSLSGIDAEDVEIVNKNGSLRLKMALTKTLQGEDVKAIIYYKKLDAIGVNEGASIESESTISAPVLSVNTSSGGVIKLDVDVERLNIKSSAGGTSTITGKAKIQDILSNSGAFVNNNNLETEQTNVTVNAGGMAKVKATFLVDAKVRAGGKITIYGNPKNIVEKTIAGGTIEREK